MSFDGEKVARKSLGVLGPALAILAILGPAVFDVTVSQEEISSVLGGVEELILKAAVLCGSVMGIVGRFRASKTISGWF